MESSPNSILFSVLTSSAVSVLLYYVFFSTSSSTPNSKLLSGKKIVDPPYMDTFFGLFKHIFAGRIDLYFNEICEKNLLSRGWILGNTLLMISDPSLMRGALRSPTIVRTPILQECYEGLSSFILFTLPTDDIWKKHRKGLQPAFGPTHLREAFGVSIEVINSLMSVWKDMYKSGVKKRNLTHDFEMLTGDIIAEVAFSVDLGCVQSLRKNDHKKPEIFHMLEKIDGAMVARTGFTKLRGLWPLLGISVEQIAPYVEKAKKIFTDIIEAKKSKLAIPVTVDGKESNLALGADLLERLLSERSDSLPWFSDEEVFGEVYGFFAAGHDTTATTLTWSMYELCKNPSVMEKLRQEVDSFNEELTTESLNSLKYLEATIKEILRIHAPVFSLTRIATDDTELKVSNGETLLVAKNEVLHLNLHTIHTSKKYWGNDAEEFNPDRWLKSGFSPEAYFPFGDGPMNCIGQKLAMIEMKIAIFHIVKNFAMKISENQTITPVFGLTLGLRNGFYVEITPR